MIRILLAITYECIYWSCTQMDLVGLLTFYVCLTANRIWDHAMTLDRKRDLIAYFQWYADWLNKKYIISNVIVDSWILKVLHIACGKYSLYFSFLLPPLEVWPNTALARSHKSCAAVDYTPIGVETHGPTRGVWPIVVVANDSQSHLVASSI